MSDPYEPSAREMAGHDEVHITSGDLSEMLRAAREEAWKEGVTAADGKWYMLQHNPYKKEASSE